MAKVNDQPFLDILIKELSRQGFKRFILCTGFHAQDIENYYRKNNFGLTIEFSRENEPLGTGGAIKLARSRVKSDPFLVLNGDCYNVVDYAKLLNFHRNKKSRISMVVVAIEDGRDFGTITLDGQKRILDFKEKVKAEGIKYINAGIYCFQKDIFNLMPAQDKFSLEIDFFPKQAGKDFYGL